MKKCSKCGESKNISEFHKKKASKDGLAYECKSCISEYKKKYYEQNRDEVLKKVKERYAKSCEDIKAYQEEYRKNNAEKVAESKKNHYEQNKEKVLLKCKIYRENNREKIAETKRIYHQKNKEYILGKVRAYHKKHKKRIAEYMKQYSKQYHKENPNIQRQFTQKRRAKLKQLPHNLKLEEWLDIKHVFNNSCAYCGMTEKEHEKHYGEKLHQEHFIPLTKGGGYEKGNIIPSCRSCNCSKNNTNFIEWYKNYKHHDSDREMKILNYISEKHS